MTSPNLPVVDFSALNLTNVNGDEASRLRENNKLNPLADDVMTAIQTFGFCYLKNHGVSLEKITTTLAVSRDVFALPKEVKKKYARRDDVLIHGYVNSEIERPKATEPIDPYEAFMVCPKLAGSCWPDEVPQFRKTSLDLHQDIQELSARVLDVIGVGLNLKDVRFFRQVHDGDHGEMRSAVYPKYPDDFEPRLGQLRFFEHCDLGSIALIYQDSVGGLEAKTPNGDWMGVPYIPGTFVLIIGQLMQIWSTDRLRAAPHRVVVLADKASRQTDRQSITFFPLMDEDLEIKCLDGSQNYESVTMKTFSLKRLAGEITEGL